MSAAQAADGRQTRLENEAAASLVKSRDLDRYWSALFAPAPARPALYALYAFNSELAHIAALTREPMVGQIRLQWWRDAIERAAPGGKTGNPVADALTAAIEERNLPRARLTGATDALLPEILGEPPDDMRQLQKGIEQSEGAIFEIACLALGARSQTAKKAAGHAALAYGLMQRLRTIPVQASRRKLLLPPSYFAARGVDVSVLYSGRTTPALGAALADLRGEANRALQRFRELAPELEPEAWPAFLPLTLVKPYLRAMAAPALDPLQTVVALNPVRRFWRIWRAARRRAI